MTAAFRTVRGKPGEPLQSITGNAYLMRDAVQVAAVFSGGVWTVNLVCTPRVQQLHPTPPEEQPDDVS